MPDGVIAQSSAPHSVFLVRSRMRCHRCFAASSALGACAGNRLDPISEQASALMGIVGASAAPDVYKSGDSHAGRTEGSHTGGRALARSNLVCVALADGALLFGLVLALAALLFVFADELA